MRLLSTFIAVATLIATAVADSYYDARVLLTWSPVGEIGSAIDHPRELARVIYTTYADNPRVYRANVDKYTPPPGNLPTSLLLKVGWTDAEGLWRGITTPAATFGEGYVQQIKLYVDEEGTLYHIGIEALGGDRAADKAEVEGVVVKPTPGPQPILNKPVVVDETGKVAGKEPEKTFLQK